MSEYQKLHNKPPIQQTALESCITQRGQTLENLEQAAAELAALTAERDKLRSMLKQVEWVLKSVIGDYDTASHECPKCHSDQPNHAPDCELAALLKGGAG